MSSILDALRKLQRDREIPDGRADLWHQRVTLPAPPGGGRGLLLVGVLIMASLGVLAAWLYGGGPAPPVGSEIEGVAAVAATEPPIADAVPQPGPGREAEAGPGREAEVPAETAVAAPRSAPAARATATPPRDTPSPLRTPAETAAAGVSAARAATTRRLAPSPAAPPTPEQITAQQIVVLEARLKRAALLGKSGEIAAATEALEALRPTQPASSEVRAKASSGRDPRGGTGAPSVAPRRTRPTPTRAPGPQVTVIPGRGDREPAPVGRDTAVYGSARITMASAGSSGSRSQQRTIDPPPPVETASAAAPRPPVPLEPQEVRGVAFPTIRVESVRWHPEPERRVAKVELEEAGPLEVRQGDIVAGVLVTLIDPAAIEIQLGTSRKRVPLEP